MREFERGVTGMERSDTLHLMEFSLTFNDYRVKICRDFVARNATKLWTKCSTFKPCTYVLHRKDTIFTYKYILLHYQINLLQCIDVSITFKPSNTTSRIKQLLCSFYQKNWIGIDWDIEK